MKKEIGLLCRAMSEILDNQLTIMKHIGLITMDYEWGDGCDNIRKLSSDLYAASVNFDDKED